MDPSQRTKTYSLCAECGRLGHLPLLKWSSKNNWELSTCAFNSAAKNEHLDILLWAKKNYNHVLQGSWIRESAALGGQLEVLKWIIKNDKDDNNNYNKDDDNNNYNMMCGNAALGGHVELLKWFKKKNPVLQ